MGVFFQRIFVTAVFLHVKRFDDFVFFGKLHLIKLQVFALRTARINERPGIQIQLNKLGDRKIGQTINTHLLLRRPPEVVQNFAPHTH